MDPLGHQVWECWGGALQLPDGAARDAARYLYKSRLLTGVRIMAKFWEFDRDKERYRRLTVDRAEIARSLGLKVQLSIDWHNTATGPSDYHKSRHFPANVPNAVASMLRDVEPDEVEVCNEPYYLKGSKAMEMKQYLGLFNQFAEGARRANWDGLIIATQDYPGDHPEGRDNGNFKYDSWIWHGNWDNCAESRHSWVLEPRSTDPQIFYEQILKSLDNPRRWAVGWHWPVWENEHSPLGRQVHINTDLGARMCLASWNAYSFKRCPWAFLTMGGTLRDFGTDGSWGMHTDLINDRGEFSLGCKALMRKAGVSVPDNIEPDPVPDPDPDPTPAPPDSMAGEAEISNAITALVDAQMRWGKPGGKRKARLARRLIKKAINARY